MTLGMAEEATIASAGDNWACSNGRGRKDEYGGGEGIGTGYGGFSETGPLCNGGRQRKKLLCMRRLWAHGPSL